MGAVASQITSLTIVYSTVWSDVDQRKHQSSASPVTGEFPAPMASNAENVSNWRRHHDTDPLWRESPVTTGSPSQRFSNAQCWCFRCRNMISRAVVTPCCSRYCNVLSKRNISWYKEKRQETISLTEISWRAIEFKAWIDIFIHRNLWDATSLIHNSGHPCLYPKRRNNLSVENECCFSCPVNISNVKFSNKNI